MLFPVLNRTWLRPRDIPSPRQLVLATGTAILALPLFWLLYNFPYDPNWATAFYPAGRAIWDRANPYHNTLFFNPPWVLPYLALLSVLPSALGRSIFVLISTSAFIFAAHRAGASKVGMAAFLLSFPVLVTVAQANLDGLVLLGLFVPAPIGLFLVMLKPQIGAGIALFWLWESWRKGGMRLVVKTFAPFAFVFAASFLIFGNWLATTTQLKASDWNLSLFPLSIPIGLALFTKALESRDIRWSLPTSLCLSPYVGMSSWSVPLFVLLKQDRALVAASFGTWLMLLAPNVHL